jgi:hypothetical protein
MNLLSKVFHTLRVWTGLAGVSRSHLTPGHGWLLPTPVEARQQRRASEALRALRREREALR